MPTKLIIQLLDAIPKEFSGDINSAVPVSLPLAPPGQAGDAATDPRDRGAGKWLWAIITDKETTDTSGDPAGNLPDVQVISDLTETWRYNLEQPEEIPGGPQDSKYRYTTDNISNTGQYAFTDAFLLQACADFEEEYFGYTCELGNRSNTQVIFAFSIGGSELPDQATRDEISQWMWRHLSATMLENRRYVISDAGIALIQTGTDDPGVLIDTWANIAPLIEDGYGK